MTARELIAEVLSPHPQDDAHVDGRYHLAWERAAGEASVAWGKAERLARMLQHALTFIGSQHAEVCTAGWCDPDCQAGRALAAIEAECE